MLGVKSTLPFKWVGPSMKKISNAGDNKMIGIFHEIASSSCSMFFLECPNLFQIKNHLTLGNSYFQFASKLMETIFHFLSTKTIVLNFTHMIPILLKLSMMQRSCFLVVEKSLFGVAEVRWVEHTEKGIWKMEIVSSALNQMYS